MKVTSRWNVLSKKCWGHMHLYWIEMERKDILFYQSTQKSTFIYSLKRIYSIVAAEKYSFVFRLNCQLIHSSTPTLLYKLKNIITSYRWCPGTHSPLLEDKSQRPRMSTCIAPAPDTWWWCHAPGIWNECFDSVLLRSASWLSVSQFHQPAMNLRNLSIVFYYCQEWI